MTDSVSMVFFQAGERGITLDDAERLLIERGLQVGRVRDALRVRWNDGPELFVGRSAELYVAEEAAELAAGTQFAEPMAACDARFEIAFADLDEVLDDINTLIEVQLTLQVATGGYLYNQWNGEIGGPDTAP